jgi:hypothetical protein
MSDDVFYRRDGRPVVPMGTFLLGMPAMVVLSIFNRRIFASSWWDFHWHLFCAARCSRRPT